jgi:hypothetical protein
MVFRSPSSTTFEGVSGRTLARRSKRVLGNWDQTHVDDC